MLIAALLFLAAGLALAWVAVVDRNIAAGLFAAPALLIAREASWLACQHFGGLTNSAAICHHGGRVIVQARPQFGCALWAARIEGDPRPDPPPEISDRP